MKFAQMKETYYLQKKETYYLQNRDKIREKYFQNRNEILERNNRRYKEKHPFKSKKCLVCNKSFFTGRSYQKYCDIKCQIKDSRIRNREKNRIYFLERRQKTKLIAVNYKGGKCVECGYNKYVGALDFHHLNPNFKEIKITNLIRNGINKKGNWKNLKLELDKCVILCANCHRQKHFYVMEVGSK